MAENQNNLPDFENPQDSKRGFKWMWWIFIVVGLFLVCLLIWFLVVSQKHETDVQKNEPYIQTEQIVPD